MINKIMDAIKKGVFLWKIIRRLNPIPIILFNIG